MSDTSGKDRYLARLLNEFDRHSGGPDTAELRGFANDVLAGIDIEDLEGRRPADVRAVIGFVWQFLQHRAPDSRGVVVFNPVVASHGWTATHTSVLVLTDGMPFVAESLRLELDRRRHRIHLLTSSDLTVERDDDHVLCRVFPASVPEGGRRQREALVYLEISRVADESAIAELCRGLEEVLADVKAVVSDFDLMAARVRDVVETFPSISAPVTASDRAENQALLEWILQENFTFLGYEEVRVDRSGPTPAVHAVAGSRLGLLRERASSGEHYLAQEIAQGLARPAEQVLFLTSSRRSRVHRAVYPDYIVIRAFDEHGQVTGQHAFLGLFTAAVYTMDPERIPIVRRKVATVIARSHPEESSHRRRSLQRVLAILPRDELFQSDTDTLFNTAMRIFHIQERRKLRLFIRFDRRRRFASCLLYWPRDAYRTELRLKIEQLLSDALGAIESEFTTVFSESVLVRTHFVMRLGPHARADHDVRELEALVSRVAEPWQDQLETALVAAFGEAGAAGFVSNYQGALPPGYQDDTAVSMAVSDIRKIDALETAASLGVYLYREPRDPEGLFHLRIYNCERPVTLSEVVPILENMGMQVLTERPYRLGRVDGRELWVHDLGLVHAAPGGLDPRVSGARIEEAFLAVMNGRAENDAFNQLVLDAGLDWRQASVLRAYGHYMKQLRHPASRDFVATTLVRHPQVARALSDLFRLRFDPALTVPLLQRKEEGDALAGRIRGMLESVAQLNEDQALRSLLALVLATVRTGVYRRQGAPAEADCVSFKFDCAAVPGMPRPVPMFEIFVASPRVQGTHLRRGPVARGGLRWSDRAEDFRTEVLGLVKAQQVKNAVIVPVGAKGGFVPLRLGSEMGRDEQQAEGIACYRLFVQSLLDLTDNIVGGVTVPPADVVCHDPPDPYLVVAADKGTASFSDIANALSAGSGFWLRDAFASGGSIGYDHKKMAITARGAWISVERHFRELGRDVSCEPFTMVGIGDMSGDVFGNGLLRSRSARLLAAFDHRHIFVDPDPVAEVSFRERERLFALPRSSWADYDPTLISEGGGVFPRTAKSIVLSPQMRSALGTDAASITPSELVSAVLCAPVDLLWFGGIGTYVKSARETHAEVGDRANDGLRVDATALRARVVGEGGNLGMTQLARIDYALSGGACNTDFIDNSGGVDCSDHEVNIKILLDGALASGALAQADRAPLLEQMREEVAALVLADNYRQAQSISLAARDSARRVAEYCHLMTVLEERAALDRALEFLPSDEALLERARRGQGLTRPELAVLSCYVKGQLKQDLLASALPDDPCLETTLQAEFPAVLARCYGDAMRSHPLRRQIIATQASNAVVDMMGPTFVARMEQSLRVDAVAVVRAFLAAREVFGVPAAWSAVESQDNRVPAALQLEAQSELQRLLRVTTRWLLRNRPQADGPSVLVDAFREPVQRLFADLQALLRGEQHTAWMARHAELVRGGLDDGLARSLAGSSAGVSALGVAEVARGSALSVGSVASIAFELNDRMGFYWLGKQLSALAVSGHWEAMARESFLDELDLQARAIVASVIARAGGGSPSAAVQDWERAHAPAVRRWLALLADLRATGARDYAMYAVAIRSLPELARASAAGG
jgi:glutamate dehydrogenase